MVRKMCPLCKKEYETELNIPYGDDRHIQQIFPNEPLWKREQLISGICSNECWEKTFGGRK